LKPKSKILIIAGSDSSGGAGIQADIKTVTSLGSYAMTAVTAITSQNTTGVKSIVSINPKEIKKQIIFTCKDIKPDAIKIGMLHSSSVIKSVISSINKIKVKKIILDPVMVAKGGTKLINSKAIKILKPGLKLGDIGYEIQTYVEDKGFSVVKDFCGHGISTVFHEPPNILHYGKKNTGMELNPGMTFTIEPMINAGKYDIKVLDDGWTAVTKDKSLSAQFEHTIGITENGYEIFTKSVKGYSKPPYL